MRIVPSVFVSGGLAGAGYVASRLESPVWPWFWVGAGAVVLMLIADKTRWTRRGAAVVLGTSSLVVGCWFASDGVPADMPGRGVYPLLILAGIVLVGAPLAVKLAAEFDWHPVRRMLHRRGKRGGRASRGQVFRVASRWAMRRKAKVLRPSLAKVSFLRRWFVVRTRAYATALARIGFMKVFSPCEDVTLRVGGPRTGKTGELIGRIVEAPGAVIATSTRTDLVEKAGSYRARIGPVRVFNPSGLGGLASSATFDPISGCGDPKTATHRAEDLLSGTAKPGSGGDMEFWNAQARRVLSALLHAAALSGLNMREVLRWVANPGSDATRSAITDGLARSPQPAFELDVLQFLGTNQRTQSSICATIMPALGWLTDATAVASTGGESLDVEALLAARGTVFMLGAEDGQTAPLVTAFTAHIAREARRIAATMPNGRLDPPLTLALDEAALICPIPLDRWTADMGGRNITLHIGVQGRSQLRQRYGDQGASTIFNNTGTLLIFGGTKDKDDLETYSALTGHRWIEAPSEPGGRPHPQRIPAFEPSQIADLKAGRVIIIRRGMGAALGKVTMAWKRRDLKRHWRWEKRQHAKQVKANQLGTTTTAADMAARVAEDTPAVTTPAPVENQPTPAHGPGYYRAGAAGGGAPASVTRIHPEHHTEVTEQAPAPVYQPYTAYEPYQGETSDGGDQ